MSEFRKLHVFVREHVDWYNPESFIPTIADEDDAVIGMVLPKHAHYGALFSAAPEMLEALEMVIAFEDWERYSHPDHKDALQYTEVVDRVRSAIAKAKGGKQ